MLPGRGIPPDRHISCPLHTIYGRWPSGVRGYALTGGHQTVHSVWGYACRAFRSPNHTLTPTYSKSLPGVVGCSVIAPPPTPPRTAGHCSVASPSTVWRPFPPGEESSVRRGHIGHSPTPTGGEQQYCTAGDSGPCLEHSSGMRLVTSESCFVTT